MDVLPEAHLSKPSNRGYVIGDEWLLYYKPPRKMLSACMPRHRDLHYFLI
jgi:hypothetical protein